MRGRIGGESCQNDIISAPLDCHTAISSAELLYYLQVLLDSSILLIILIFKTISHRQINQEQVLWGCLQHHHLPHVCRNGLSLSFIKSQML